MRLPWVEGEDPDSYTFAWEDVLSIHRDNSGMTDLRINAIASPNVRRDLTANKWYEADWLHRVALNAVDTNGDDVLGDDKKNIGFTRRALELGHPCPPRCGLQIRHQMGQIPRDTCACP